MVSRHSTSAPDVTLAALSFAYGASLDVDVAAQAVGYAIGAATRSGATDVTLLSAVGQRLAAPSASGFLPTEASVAAFRRGSDGVLHQFAQLPAEQRSALCVQAATGASYEQLEKLEPTLNITAAIAQADTSVCIGVDAARCVHSGDVTHYVDGELSPEAARAFEQHRATCVACAKAVDDVGAFRQFVAQHVGQALPRELVERLRQDPQAPASVQLGAVLGGYRLVAKIGEGGMGSVYRAEHTLTGRVVALKVVRPQATMQARLRDRFLQEIRASAALDHPNVVATIDAGEADGVLYQVLEFVGGESLAAKIEQRPLSVPEVVAIADGVAAALAHAEAHGVVHRDIKPANIMVTASGSAKLLDLGVAKLRDGACDLGMDLTRTGDVVGTPAYMAPEQIIHSAKVDHRADLYALGITMAVAVLGRRPVSGVTPEEVMGQALAGNVDLSGLASTPELHAVVRKLTRRSPADRYQHADELRQDLAALRRGERPELAFSRTAASKTRMRRALVVASVVAAVVLLVVGLFSWAPWGPGSGVSDNVLVAIDKALQYRIGGAGAAVYDTQGELWTLIRARRSELVMSATGLDYREVTSGVRGLISMGLTEAGRFAGVPFNVQEDNTGFVPATADLALALALAHGRVEVDVKPKLREVYTYLCEAQNVDGSWSCIPALGAEAADGAATAYALYALLPAATALGCLDDALPRALAAGKWLAAAYEYNVHLFDISPATKPKGGGPERYVQGYNAMVVVALLQLTYVAGREGVGCDPSVVDVLRNSVQTPMKADPSFVAVDTPRPDAFAGAAVAVPEGVHTSFRSFSWLGYPWRLIMWSAVQEGGVRVDLQENRRAQQAAVFAAAAEAPTSFREAEAWALADLLYGLAAWRMVTDGAKSVHPVDWVVK